MLGLSATGPEDLTGQFLFFLSCVFAKPSLMASYHNKIHHSANVFISEHGRKHRKMVSSTTVEEDIV